MRDNEDGKTLNGSQDVKDAVETLVDIMRTASDDATRLTAAKAVLDFYAEMAGVKVNRG